MRSGTTALALLGALLVSTPATADWTLDNTGSQLSFVTIKAGNVAEVHTFGELSGAVGSDGRARVVIQLASVNTLIPIRDERMRELLFKTDLFPTADVVTKLDIVKLARMAPSTSEVLSAELVLTLGDATLPITAELMVSKLAADRVLVATLKPIVVNAASVGLTDGVEALREIAGLPSISGAVPVSFVLQFVEPAGS
ncbi:MAG: YceI family protein [Pseudomonadales bacterium]